MGGKGKRAGTDMLPQRDKEKERREGGREKRRRKREEEEKQNAEVAEDAERHRRGQMVKEKGRSRERNVEMPL